ncbi:MAG: DUF6788 family protein [Gammaproteobacteria bacterium]
MYAIPMTQQRLAQIEKRIVGIRRELAGIGPMRPGSLTRQYKDPKNRSSPYYQLSYTREMKSRTEYIPRDRLSEVRGQIRTYKRFRALTEEWVRLSIERCRLLIGHSSARPSRPRQ